MALCYRCNHHEIYKGVYCADCFVAALTFTQRPDLIDLFAAKAEVLCEVIYRRPGYVAYWCLFSDGDRVMRYSNEPPRNPAADREYEARQKVVLAADREWLASLRR